MLRRYHELGLLEPAAIHPVSGYRSYRPNQAVRAATIRELRELGMPLGEIRGLLDAPTRSEVEAIIGRHRARLIDDLTIAQRRLARIERFVTEEHAMLDKVTVSELPRLHVASRRFEGPTAMAGRLGTEASNDLVSALGRDRIALVGLPVLLAHHTDEERVELELCLPIAGDAKPSADVVVRDVEPCRAAVTRHAGTWEEGYLTIQSLIFWIGERGHTPVMPWRAYILATNPLAPAGLPAGPFEAVCDYAVAYR